MIVFVGFCKDLLEVADVLQKAVEAAKSEDERLGSSLASGIEMTQTQMHQVFNRHGLSKISPIEGETKFDPNMHEALFQIPAPDKGIFCDKTFYIIARCYGKIISHFMLILILQIQTLS